VVMVVHHALADPGFPVGDGGAHCRDHAAGLVTGDHAGRALDATRDDSTRIGRGAVGVQVAAAHARGLDLEDHVARAGCRIGELPELELAISEKHDAFHGPPPVRGVGRARPTGRSSVPSEACRGTGHPRFRRTGDYGIFGRDRADHSGLMPADLITLPHFSVSSATNCPNWTGVIGIGTPPSSAKRPITLGSVSTALISLFSFSTMSAG